jgi:hypothetical protein
VLAADDHSAEFEVDGTAMLVSYDDIARAVVQVEFTRADEAQTDDDEPATDPEEG